MIHFRIRRSLCLFGVLLTGAILAPAAVATTGSAYTGTEPPPPNRAPYLPKHDNTVLQLVPARNNPAIVKMRALRAQLDAKPHDVALADKLARAYVSFGREIGDAHYSGYATAVIAPWMKLNEPPPPVLVTQAVILQFLHKFDPARKLLKAAIKRAPDNMQAWLTLSSVDMIQGRYHAANIDCVNSAKAGGPLLGIMCSGALRSFVGHAEQAQKMLTLISAPSTTIPPPVESYIQGLLAETAERLGEWKQANAHFEKALEFTPHDNFTLVNYADLLLYLHQPEKVLRLLNDDQQSDTAFLRITLAHQQMHSPDLARYTWIMVARFEALTLRGSHLFGREHSRFALHVLHDPQLALELAERNWKVQRAPWDQRVFLEAALATHKPAAALPVLKQLDETHLQDPIIQPLAAKVRAELAAEKKS